MKNCWSWEGEDILAAKIAHDVLGLTTGFYVDVGAHHPFDLSNTQHLYEIGWRGINIDATPGSKAVFDEHRPEDVNVECAIGEDGRLATFYTFENGTLNGFITPAMVRKHEARGEKSTGSIELPQRSIRSVLNEHNVEKVDLLNIDVEGSEDRILAEWPGELLPSMIVSEVLGPWSVRDTLEQPLVQQIEAMGYVLFSRLHFSCIFLRSPDEAPPQGH